MPVRQGPWRPPLGWGALLGALGLFVWAARLRTDIALGLVVLGGLFTVLERVRPLHNQLPAVRRKGATTDATHFVVDEIFAAAGLIATLAVVMPVVRMAMPSVVPAAIRGQAGWAIWAEALVFAEVAGYWGHRLTHSVPFLWRFHRVHHSSPTMDWLAPSRRHPLDQVFSRASVAIPVLALGFAVPTVITHFAIKRFQGLFVHANIDIRLGPLEWFIATPHFHHWHHSAEPGTWDKNFAGQVPLVDWLFGTLHRPAHWPLSYGCDGYVPDIGYLAQLRAPWDPNRNNASLADRVNHPAKGRADRCVWSAGRSGPSTTDRACWVGRADQAGRAFTSSPIRSSSKAPRWAFDGGEHPPRQLVATGLRSPGPVERALHDHPLR